LSKSYARQVKTELCHAVSRLDLRLHHIFNFDCMYFEMDNIVRRVDRKCRYSIQISLQIMVCFVHWVISLPEELR